MVRLSRKGVKAPKSFTNAVGKKLPPTFLARAKAFEKLAMDGAKRRAGFAAYAPDALPKKKNGKPEFPSLWGATKATVGKISDGMCAYCQLIVFGGQPGDVEHFKPKSLFPTQAYVIDNYFLGCRTCNGTKSNKWPTGRLTYVDPAVDDPATHFDFDESGGITARKASKRAQVTISDFELDRPTLVIWRRKEIARQLLSLRALLATGLPPAQARSTARTLLREDLSQLSAAVNACLRREWQAQTGTKL